MRFMHLMRARHMHVGKRMRRRGRFALSYVMAPVGVCCAAEGHATRRVQPTRRLQKGGVAH